MPWKSAVSIALFAIATAGSASAATYYVSNSGSDASNGALTAPLKTIQKAASLAKAGDTVSVRGGVYNELVSITASGTSTSHITFSAYPGENPVIDGNGLGLDKNLVTLTGSWIDFSGFEVRNATRIGICGWGASNVTVRNNKVHDSVRNGIYFGYSAMGTVANITADGNTVYNNVLENQNMTMTGGGWASALNLSWCTNATITNNTVYQNYGEGIDVLLSTGGVIRQNRSYDNFSVEIYLDNAKSISVDRNFVYSSGDTRYYRNSYPASGIAIANETYSASNPSSGNLITNNIVVNSRWGFYYGSYGSGGGLQSTTIANNTFYKGATALLWIDNGPHAGNTIENNIFSQVGATMTSISGGGITFRNNNWYGGTAGAAAGSGDILADPRLANAGGLTAADYKVTSGTPVTSMGVAVSSVSADYFGTVRTTTNDIGAHQAGVIATADTQAPTAPANLRVDGITTSSVTIAWDAATDNVGVASYIVYRDGSVAATVSSLTWTDSALSTGVGSSAQHVYQVLASDAAGNKSALSASITAGSAPVLSTATPAPTMPTTSKKRSAGH